MDTLTVRPVEDADRVSLVAVMARAFSTDPCFSWVFRTEHRRRSDLTLLFETAWAALAPHGRSVTTEDRAAVALWAPPGKHRVDESITAPFGARMAERYEPDAMQRLLTFFGLTDHHHPETPHYYLGVLATDTVRQGQGLGSACLADVLREVDAAGAPAYLESSCDRNLPLYERHGFRVKATAYLPEGGPPIYFMWRDPQ